MKKSRFSDQQIVGILHEWDVGAKVADLVRRHRTIHCLRVNGVYARGNHRHGARSSKCHLEVPPQYAVIIDIVTGLPPYRPALTIDGAPSTVSAQAPSGAVSPGIVWTVSPTTDSPHAMPNTRLQNANRRMPCTVKAIGGDVR
jgi:hypothetical protein